MNKIPIRELFDVVPFRVSGGAIGDKLWEMLFELGITDYEADYRNPQVQFVSALHKIDTHPDAIVIMIALVEYNDLALDTACARKWEGPIFVDAVDKARGSYLRSLARWLFHPKPKIVEGDAHDFIILSEGGDYLTRTALGSHFFWSEHDDPHEAEIHTNIADIFIMGLTWNLKPTHVIPARYDQEEDRVYLLDSISA